MVGVVTTRDLFTHPHEIVREFGARCYLRCVWRTLTVHGSVTFLECIRCSRRVRAPLPQRFAIAEAPAPRE
jgi:hypothetical protein